MPTLEGHGGELALAGLGGRQALAGESIFTLSGGHIFPIYDACSRGGTRIIDVRHEQTAAFAAEGAAKLTRRPGIAVLTAGPGVTNGMSALATAHFNGSPLSCWPDAPLGPGGGPAPSRSWTTSPW